MKTKISLISPAQHQQLLASIAARAQLSRYGVQDLPRDERIYYAVTALHDTLINDGLEYFITNCGPAMLGDAITGLIQLKANRTLAAVLRAAGIVYSKGDVRRGALIDEHAEEDDIEDARDELAELDDMLMDDPDRIAERLEAFAHRQNLVVTVLADHVIRS